MSNDARYASIYPEYEVGKYFTRLGLVPYYGRLQAIVNKESTMLEVGCGRGIHRDMTEGFLQDIQIFKGKVRRVIGIDVSDYAQDNTSVDEFRLITGKEWPVESTSIDVCYSDWVIEHVEDVDAFFAEAFRVLKPGGYFAFRTPNRLHYSSVGASMIPHRLHYKVRQILGHFHEEQDVFPTYYRANTVWRCNRLMRRHGFKPTVLAHRGVSHLMDMSYVTGVIGKWMEELSPSMFWHEIHAFGRKPVA